VKLSLALPLTALVGFYVFTIINTLCKPLETKITNIAGLVGSVKLPKIMKYLRAGAHVFSFDLKRFYTLNLCVHMCLDLFYTSLFLTNCIQVLVARHYVV
jgi:hypothetical protein